MKTRAALVLATWFGCGYSPAAPGTVGTLGAMVPALFLSHHLGWPPWSFGVLAIAFYFPAVWSAGVAAVHSGRKDPGLVVIDEVVGEWITLAGATTLNWKSWLLAFALFRIFDIWKPFPARQAESLPGGWGIVNDDVLAGIYGALVLLLLGWFNLY